MVGGEVLLEMLDDHDLAEHEKELATQGPQPEIGQSQAVKRRQYVPLALVVYSQITIVFAIS